MSKKIVLLGEKDNFFLAMKDRLERLGAFLTHDSEEADLTIGLGSHALDESVDVAIIAENGDPRSGNMKEIKNAGLIIRIHDLMIPEGSQGWGPVDVEEWVDWVKNESSELTPEIQPKHWVHIRDTTDAVSLLVMADTDAFAQGVIDLCGRRAWSPESVISEIDLLWNRFTNAIAHSHTISSLSGIPSPAAFQYEGKRNRPDLKPLHKAMQDAGREEGWRPLTPMRVALMEFLAHAKFQSEPES
jgi:hypothetical protein